IIQNVGISNDLWLYKSKDGQSLLKAIISHLNKYSNRYSHPKGDEERIMKVDLFLLKPLMYIANIADKIGSKSKKNIEHDYLQGMLKKFNGKYSLDYNNKSDIDINVGLSSEIRKNGIPPFWMLGVA
ncbi:3329_t:CDS:1, partial [Cetraspora pellucida]